MIRVAVLASPTFGALHRLPSDPDLEFDVARESSSFRRLLQGADAVLISPRFGQQLRDSWAEIGSVRWIHCFGAGVETLPFDLLRKSDIVVTNGRGVFADALAEFAIAAMLWFAKDLRGLMDNQAVRKWRPVTIERLEGATVGIVGYGAIGRAVGRRAEALGMRVLTTGRSGGTPVDALLGSSDYVVISAALTSETKGMISAVRITLMRPTAVLINVARGSIVDEAALIQALQAKRIRGAALDVFEIEPLPPDHPLWALKNVLISPHAADHAADSHDRAMSLFLQNLERFRREAPLLNVVDKSAGY